MIRKILIVSIAMSSTAMAQTKITPYLSLSGGYGMLNDSDIKLNGVDLPEATYDDGTIIEGAVGLKFDKGMDVSPLRAELALAHQTNDDQDGDETTMQTLMVNAYLDIFTGTPLSPYLTIGAGTANVDNEAVGDDDSAALQAGAGLGYALTKNIILDLKYRYIMAEDLEFKSAGSKATVEISGHQLQLGARYEF